MVTFRWIFMFSYHHCPFRKSVAKSKIFIEDKRCSWHQLTTMESTNQMHWWLIRWRRIWLLSFQFWSQQQNVTLFGVVKTCKQLFLKRMLFMPLTRSSVTCFRADVNLRISILVSPSPNTLTLCFVKLKSYSISTVKTVLYNVDFINHL